MNIMEFIILLLSAKIYGCLFYIASTQLDILMKIFIKSSILLNIDIYYYYFYLYYYYYYYYYLYYLYYYYYYYYLYYYYYHYSYSPHPTSQELPPSLISSPCSQHTPAYKTLHHLMTYI